ncbi:hypothetical protein SH611_17175 [Geminicoccaceae bacterium 1502E]|nr:hypothetical protein [Geminicoccaceae bacterium 1502E]
MKHLALTFAAAAFAALAVQPAAAAEYKCACYKEAKKDLEASDKAKIKCSETYDSFSKSVSVPESHVKIYVDDDNVVQGDKDANIRFRPRDGKCLEQVADGNAEKALFTGAYCNNDSYKDIGQFKLAQDKTTPSVWTAAYKATTGGKDYTGFLQYTEAADGKRYMQAACIENK